MKYIVILFVFIYTKFAAGSCFQTNKNDEVFSLVWLATQELYSGQELNDITPHIYWWTKSTDDEYRLRHEKLTDSKQVFENARNILRKLEVEDLSVYAIVWPDNIFNGGGEMQRVLKVNVGFEDGLAEEGYYSLKDKESFLAGSLLDKKCSISVINFNNYGTPPEK